MLALVVKQVKIAGVDIVTVGGVVFEVIVLLNTEVHPFAPVTVTVYNPAEFAFIVAMSGADVIFPFVVDQA